MTLPWLKLFSWRLQDKAGFVAKPELELRTPDDSANDLYSDYNTQGRESGQCVIFPQNPLVPQEDRLLAWQNSVTLFNERGYKHLFQQLWLQLRQQKAASSKWVSPCSCLNSGSATSGVIWSHWLNLPESLCPHLPNGDNESILSITRILWGIKETASRKRIGRLHSTVYIHQSY